MVGLGPGVIVRVRVKVGVWLGAIVGKICRVAEGLAVEVSVDSTVDVMSGEGIA